MLKKPVLDGLAFLTIEASCRRTRKVASRRNPDSRLRFGISNLTFQIISNPKLEVRNHSGFGIADGKSELKTDPITNTDGSKLLYVIL